MKRYEVVVSHRAELMLASHIAFLARVSMKAARRLRDEFAEMLDALETNPFLFAEAEADHIPEGYRKALFRKRYLAVLPYIWMPFWIAGWIIPVCFDPSPARKPTGVFRAEPVSRFLRASPASPPCISPYTGSRGRQKNGK